jgi:hypothetical protein
MVGPFAATAAAAGEGAKNEYVRSSAAEDARPSPPHSAGELSLWRAHRPQTLIAKRVKSNQGDEWRRRFHAEHERQRQIESPC